MLDKVIISLKKPKHNHKRPFCGQKSGQVVGRVIFGGGIPRFRRIQNGQNAGLGLNLAVDHGLGGSFGEIRQGDFFFFNIDLSHN
jgi:hypothetical protein